MKILIFLVTVALASMAWTAKVEISEETMKFHIVLDASHSITAHEAKIYNDLRSCDTDEIKNIINDAESRNLVLSRFNWKPIHVAAAFCGPAIMNLFMQAGFDINTRAPDGETPLFIAMLYDNVDTRNLLYYDRTARKDILTTENWGLLHFVALRSMGGSLKSLLNRNPHMEVDPPGGDRKLTPLMLAIMMKNLDVVEILLEKGASDLVTDSEGINAPLLASITASRFPSGDASHKILEMVANEVTKRRQQNVEYGRDSSSSSARPLKRGKRS